MHHWLVVPIILFPLLWILRPTLRRKPTPRRSRSKSDPCRLAVFLGSGGHTSEALTLLSCLDFSRYYPRTYIISDGDAFSAQKAIALETSKAAGSAPQPTNTPYTIITIPRARRVHQTLLTTPFTAFRSLLACMYHVYLRPLITRIAFADILILNGPGTCLMLCLAAYLNRLLGVPSPRIIYVESFARVRTLSLSGKLLRLIVDRFVVQWPDLLRDGKRGECRGWLV
ncbi:glycosyltransferase family 1 protein [Wolfiporia cocos MD-104 SS10]|uniref:UDP-N-acetylglucosamine transferase subunit ALG14 n=1 Tax=Wolfiporia cocos (strain MD-104) TaxID=742152 RepID=A0A2H3JUL2_WOLCO|nr:glycosyltransferase family 1 protein [Wolfiporia cocos MD-104 SS10]